MHIDIQILVVTLKEGITHPYSWTRRWAAATTIPDTNYVRCFPSTAFSEEFCEVWTLFPAAPGSVISPACEHRCLQRVPSAGQRGGRSHRSQTPSPPPRHDGQTPASPCPAPRGSINGRLAQAGAQLPSPAPAPSLPAATSAPAVPLPREPPAERRSPGPLYLRFAGARLC